VKKARSTKMISMHGWILHAKLSKKSYKARVIKFIKILALYRCMPSRHIRLITCLLEKNVLNVFTEGYLCNKYGVKAFDRKLYHASVPTLNA
jgi:hypothetical protein